ncbi:MAG: energy transducer TonB [Rhodocyclaceae bacterium]|nr:MAG: energy transducer TonB [Rhodocyclaceae bacterium]
MGVGPLDWRLVRPVLVSLALHAAIAMTGSGGGGSHPARSASPPLSVTLVHGTTPLSPAPRHEVAAARAVDATLGLLPDWAPALPVEDRYYAANEVDVRAEFTRAPEVEYPDRALFAEVNGVVRVRVLINESGTVDAIDILAANPPEVFDKAVIAALLKARFSPARKFGLKVKSEKIFEFTLVAEDVQPAPR